jgi:ATP-binding cassette subfamily B multidrug efflux pump
MALAPLPLVSVGVKFFGAKIHERFEKIQALYSEITERVRENISGVRVVRAFCQEDAEMATFRRDEPGLRGKKQGLIWITSFLWPAMGLMYAVALMMVLVVGGQHVVRGNDYRRHICRLQRGILPI